MSETIQLNLDELVKIYLTIRGEREKMESEWKGKDKELQNEQALQEQIGRAHV